MCEIINKVLTAAQKAFLDSQFYFIFYCCFFIVILLLLLFLFLDPCSKKQTNKTATFGSCNCMTCMNACMEGTVNENAVKTPKLTLSFTFSQAIQRPSQEALRGRFWPQGLMLKNEGSLKIGSTHSGCVAVWA